MDTAGESPAPSPPDSEWALCVRLCPPPGPVPRSPSSRARPLPSREALRGPSRLQPSPHRAHSLSPGLSHCLGTAVTGPVSIDAGDTERLPPPSPPREVWAVNSLGLEDSVAVVIFIVNSQRFLNFSVCEPGCLEEVTFLQLDLKAGLGLQLTGKEHSSGIFASLVWGGIEG